MSQNDLSIANQGFASFRSDLNSALQALGSTNSGTSAPSTTYANQLFYDTSSNILKIRNEDNDAFISLFTLDQVNDNIESLTIDGAINSKSLDVNGSIVCSPNTDGKNTFELSTSDVNEGRLRIKDVDTTTIEIRAGGNSFLNGGNVGIGTSSPATLLHVEASSGNGSMQLISSTTGTSFINMGDTGDADAGQISYINNDNAMAFKTNAGERMRIDSSGAVRIANTSGTLFNSSSATGVVAGTSLQVATSGATALFVNRISNDGQVVGFYQGGTQVGAIITRGGEFLSVGAGDTFLEYNFGSDQINPSSGNSARDNAIDLGSSGARFDDIFATNSSIQTSDQNEKQDIASATTKELNVAKKLSTLFKTFRWKDKVTEKGDKARTHTGIVAQEVQSAFEAEGLDASKYGLFTSDTWTNEDGKEQTRLGVRYPELFSFIFSSIEARLTALESK